MPRMFGTSIMLREFMQSDLDEMCKWKSDPESTRYLSDTFTVPQTWDQSANFLDSILSGKNPGVHLVIANLMTGEYLGQCDLMNITSYSHKAEMAIVLGPEHRGKGYASEAIDLLLELAFDHMNLNRIYLRVFTENQPAIKCYDRCGFVREGMLRQDYYSYGEYHDVIMMGILRDEWRRTRARK